MNELVCIRKDEPMTTSIQVAEMFHKRHSNVVRAIEKNIKALLKNEQRLGDRKMYFATREKMTDGQMHKIYYMNRQGFELHYNQLSVLCLRGAGSVRRRHRWHKQNLDRR